MQYDKNNPGIYAYVRVNMMDLNNPIISIVERVKIESGTIEYIHNEILNNPDVNYYLFKSDLMANRFIEMIRSFEIYYCHVSRFLDNLYSVNIQVQSMDVIIPEFVKKLEGIHLLPSMISDEYGLKL